MAGEKPTITEHRSGRWQWKCNTLLDQIIDGKRKKKARCCKAEGFSVTEEGAWSQWRQHSHV